jgi:hypothetical protein
MENSHLKTFSHNGYRNRDIMHTFVPKQRSQTKKEKLEDAA